MVVALLVQSKIFKPLIVSFGGRSTLSEIAGDANFILVGSDLSGARLSRLSNALDGYSNRKIPILLRKVICTLSVVDMILAVLSAKQVVSGDQGMNVLLTILVYFQLTSAFSMMGRNGGLVSPSTLMNRPTSVPQQRVVMSSVEPNTGGAAVIAASVAPSKGGQATMANSIFNLAKSIVGCGVLSLPSGIAFFSDAPSAVLPASVLCAAMGVMSAYTFSIIGRACEQHNVNSFQDCWAKSVDEKSAWLISASITTMCFLASLAYSIIIADSFTSLAQSFHLPPILSARSNIITILTATVLYPLCSLPSLAALSPFSLMGLGGTLYAALFMAIRYFDGSYAKGGRFFSSLPAGK
jgi:hypothetical protein